MANDPKLRPRKTRHGNEKHGICHLATLLKGSLDGRLKLKKERDYLESQLVEHCGGMDRLTPPMLSLIKRIVHKELIAAQSERMALLGEYDLMSERYLSLANSLRSDVMALETLIKTGGKREHIQTVAEIFAEIDAAKGDRDAHIQ